ncbi:hypothetical protein Hypma_005351 [Hypsizygus marmoreus]|uniref:Protein kinase domain-containing protein n=1 Tax=Hypsizygus marmoreus TaxID=39966 RepID=A0A369JYB3_HYPMA|nr:hypothetical protein Hypma_005351 [Hypsizygus marmoreus]
MQVFCRSRARKFTLPTIQTSVRDRCLHVSQTELRSVAESHPYSAGSDLDLQFTPETGPSRPLSIHVVKPFEPFTSAVALLVRPRSSIDANALGLPSLFVVKISDRRYSNRDGFLPWSPALEASLQAAVEYTKEGKKCSPELEETWDMEVQLYEFKQRCHDREVAAYLYLRTLQGQDIPFLYGTFRFPFSLAQGSSGFPRRNNMTTPILDYAEGLAFEYIDGMNMGEVQPDVDIPRADIERTSENTLQIMKRLRDLYALHKECRPQNVMIRRQYPHNPVLIDFGQTNVKLPHMSVQKWKEYTENIDEIKDMRYALSRAGVHVESPVREWEDRFLGYAFFNDFVERRSQAWREQFHDPVFGGPLDVMQVVDGKRIRWQAARWKLKAGVKEAYDHRCD